MQYFKTLLKTLQDIANNLAKTNDKQNEILLSIEGKIHKLNDVIWDTGGDTFTWDSIIDTNLIEDSRDKGVMLKKDEAIKVITLAGDLKQTVEYTRIGQLDKDEKKHYEKYGVVVIINF